MQTFEDLIGDDPILRATPERLSWATNRWLRNIVRLHPKIARNRHISFVVRGPMVFGSLLVPIVATAAVNSGGTFWDWATVGVSILVASCTTVDHVYRPVARWRLVRETRNALEAEGWAFFERSGLYGVGDDAERFQSFFASVEHFLANYEGAYLMQIAQPQELPSTVGGGKLDSLAKAP